MDSTAATTAPGRPQPNSTTVPTPATTAMHFHGPTQPTTQPATDLAPTLPVAADAATSAATEEPQLTRSAVPAQRGTTSAITRDPTRQEHRLSLIADDELATRHLIFDREPPTFAATAPAPATLQPLSTRAGMVHDTNAQLANRIPNQQQQYPHPLFALPIPPPPPTLSIMANQQHPPPSMVAPAARGHGLASQQQQPPQAASGLAFPSLSNLMPATSEPVNGNQTTLELAILANSAASQHFGMPLPHSHSSSHKLPPLAQQRARSRSLAQATTVSAPFTTRSDPVPGPNAGSASFLPTSAAAAAFPTTGLITTPGMSAYPTRIAAHAADDSATALAARARSMSTPQLTSQDDLLGKSSIDQAFAAEELQRLRTQQMHRAFGNSRSSPDPGRNRMSAASSSISMTNRFSSSSTHNLVGDRIDRPVSASSTAAIPPQSPGFPASEHDAAVDDNVAGQPALQPPAHAPTTSPPTATHPGWPLTAAGEPSDYLTRVPVISTYTFHDFPSISHYTSGAIPFSRSSAITAPPVIVPINPQTFRLARNWAKTGDRPVAFHTLSETLAEMHHALDSVRRTGVRADPAVVSAHRLAVARAVNERAAGVVGGGGAGGAGGMGKVDALVDEVNAWMRKWDRVGAHAVVDWVLGVVTGWAHHLCLPMPGQADMDAFDDWLDNINEHWMHPRYLHMRNPFDNGLMFLELELLDVPVHALAANAPLP